MNGFSMCNGMVYTVKAGDTLYAIGKQFGVPVWLLLQANPGIDIYNIMVGSKLCIPVVCNCDGGNRPPMRPPVNRPMPRDNDEWMEFDRD